MRLACVVRYDALAKLFEDGVEGCRMLGRIGIQQPARAASVERTVCRLIAETGEMLGDEISYLPTHLLHGRVVELERQRR